jgi:hypothetical protein
VALELENLKSARDNKTPSPYNTIPQRIGNWKEGDILLWKLWGWLQELEVAQDLSALETLYEGRSSVLMMMMMVGYWW